MSNIGYSSPDWGFNTQPPEGGWIAVNLVASVVACFNTQPPEGGWCLRLWSVRLRSQFQHTAARRRLGEDIAKQAMREAVSTHSRPKAAGVYKSNCTAFFTTFQHTAARRRLVGKGKIFFFADGVSTHSRPKAAG